MKVFHRSLLYAILLALPATACQPSQAREDKELAGVRHAYGVAMGGDAGTYGEAVRKLLSNRELAIEFIRGILRSGGATEAEKWDAIVLARSLGLTELGPDLVELGRSRSLTLRVSAITTLGQWGHAPAAEFLEGVVKQDGAIGKPDHKVAAVSLLLIDPARAARSSRAALTGLLEFKGDLGDPRWSSIQQVLFVAWKGQPDTFERWASDFKFRCQQNGTMDKALCERLILEIDAPKSSSLYESILRERELGVPHLAEEDPREAR